MMISAPTSANELKLCETKVEQGFVCPDDFVEKHLELKVVCAEGCFLNHPDDQRKLESSFRLAEERLVLLEKKRQESLDLLALNKEYDKKLGEVQKQRDALILDVETQDSHIELLNNDIDTLRFQSKSQFTSMELAGGIVVGFTVGFLSCLGAVYFSK